jgi:hypothetical protein
LGTTYPGDIWEFTVQDYKACCPNPPNEAVILETDVLLSWAPGFSVEDHDVYMGTSWEDVSNAVYDHFNPPPEFVATRSEPNILVTYLTPGVKYYWRVDEVVGRGPPDWIPHEYYKGDVWEFTVQGYKSSSPNPADEAVIPGEIVSGNIATKLIFLPGVTAVEHTGYFSDNYDEVANRIEDANLGPPPYGDQPDYKYTFFVGYPGVPPAEDSLVRGMTYYWCVDETDALGTTYPGDVWEFTILNYQASSPSPPNEAVIEETDVLLYWSEGAEVEEHDVYMGTSWENVYNAVYDPNNPPPEYLGTVTEPSFMITGLSENTTYYWRVDEVSGRFMPGTGTIYKGDVWAFTVRRYKASSPNPPDGAVIVETDVLLSWSEGFEVEEHDVYMGTSWENVKNAVYDPNNPSPEYFGTVTDPCFMVTGLSENTTYYWRIDEVSGRFMPGTGTIYKGDVWEFTVMSYYATKPDPPNETMYVNIDVLLSWQVGYDVDVHDVYIGTNWDLVFNADEFDTTGIYKGWTVEPNWPCSGLPADTKIYWRIDEVHDRTVPGSGTIYKGDVWCFTTLGGKAQPDYPEDGAVIVGDMVGGNISTELIFVPGATAVEHTGYFSDDYSKVENRHPDANLGPPPYGNFPGYEYTFWVGNPQVPPADETLVRGVTYYWCVDETDALGTTYPGDIWEFTVQDYKACCPNPPNEAVILETDVLLSWSEGFGVEEHDVYMGTSWEGVYNAVYDHFNPPPEFVATRQESNIAVTGLELNTTYYWRVDEIIGRGPPDWIPHEYYKGDVWSFTIFGITMIQGFVDFDPDILNLASQGNLITAYIGLPEEYNVADIDPGSILLEGEIEPQEFWLTGDQQIAIVRFARSDVQAILEVGEVELTITGQLTDGTLFEAKDTIEVVDSQ